ncbi:MAG: PEP-CTERM sorting domain-containing protein [Sedimenticola sp.]
MTISRFFFIFLLLISALFASPASASVIFSIEATAGSYTGSGTMVFADGASGEIVGTNPDWLSFDFTINGENFVLSDMFSSSTEGVLLSASSDFLGWTNGSWVEFAPDYPPELLPSIGFSTSSNGFYYSDVSFQDTRGTFTVTRIPEPATLALMGLGLAGIGFARKKKAA